MSRLEDYLKARTFKQRYAELQNGTLPPEWLDGLLDWAIDIAGSITCGDAKNYSAAPEIKALWSSFSAKVFIIKTIREAQRKAAPADPR
jgi:hypothetical protein